MRLPAAFDALRDPSLARYLGAVTVSTLGSGMAMVALAFAVLDFGGATDLGLVLLAREIPVVVFLLLGGVFADRLPRRAILVGCDVVKGSAQAVTAPGPGERSSRARGSGRSWEGSSLSACAWAGRWS